MWFVRSDVSTNDGRRPYGVTASRGPHPLEHVKVAFHRAGWGRPVGSATPVMSASKSRARSTPRNTSRNNSEVLRGTGRHSEVRGIDAQVSELQFRFALQGEGRGFDPLSAHSIGDDGRRALAAMRPRGYPRTSASAIKINRQTGPN